MLQNYFLLAFRNLVRNKVFSVINILGLAAGIAACFLIAQYIQFELSYDRFHSKGDRIFRVTNNVRRPNGTFNHMATNHPATGPTLQQDFPEVEAFARLTPQPIYLSTVTSWSITDSLGNEKIFNHERVFDADPSFLTMFSFPFLYGDPEHALDENFGLVLSEEVSRKFFGDENPMGRQLLLGRRTPFRVTGVVRIPENSHIKFDMLTSLYLKRSDGNPDRSGEWKFSEFFTYVLLRDPAIARAGTNNRQKLEAKLGQFVERHVGETMRQANRHEQYLLQPVPDIHLHSPKMTKEIGIHGNAQTVYFLVIVAAMILLIAWINYVNLSTCKSMERAREVGIRKTAGGSRAQLMSQFLFESCVLNVLAMTIALLFVALALPYFNQLVGKNMGATFWELSLVNQPWFWLTLLSVFVLGTFGAGLYPAFVLSSFRIATVLKGKYSASTSGIFMRRLLVGSQFAISVALLAGTLVVYQQVSFMRNQDLGYVKEQLLVVQAPRFGDSTFMTRLNTFKAEVKRNPHVINLAPTSEIPGKDISQVNGIRRFDAGTEGNVLSHHFYIDPDFLGTYGLELKAGRNFLEGEFLPWSDGMENGTHPVMLNEEGVRMLGFKSPGEAVDQVIKFGLGAKDWPGRVVGVVENHHQQSLREEYDVILYFPVRNFSGTFYTVRMDLDDIQGTIGHIKARYEEQFPGNQFDYFFLDEFFDRQYAADRQFGRVFGLFSGLALGVACIGLIGLSTFMISRRIKEIAIRKVLGATLASMINLFSRDFVWLILAANVVALPFTYFLVDRWLSTFAFRTEIGWVMFIAPAALLLLVSLATVCLQTIRTGTSNPAGVLRAE